MNFWLVEDSRVMLARNEHNNGTALREEVKLFLPVSISFVLSRVRIYDVDLLSIS